MVGKDDDLKAVKRAFAHVQASKPVDMEVAHHKPSHHHHVRPAAHASHSDGMDMTADHQVRG